MTKLYLGSGKTEYTFNSNISIELTDEDLEELVILSSNYQKLFNKQNDLKVNLKDANKQINELEHSNDELYDIINDLKESHKEEIDKRINEAQVMISSLRLIINKFPDGHKLLEELEKETKVL